MERECPDCKHSHDPELVPELNGACPKCMTDLLKDSTEPMSPAQVNGLSSVPGMAPFDPGDLYHGMEIVEFLGQGGMGYVYKARETELDRVVALKILDPKLAASEEFKLRFSREAKALASLNHPNIVQIYGFGSTEGYHYLIMEFIDGTTLRQVMSTQSIEPEVALRYVPQICDALEYAHKIGVVHRDIKPENILLDKQGNLKIADFGLAKITLADQQHSQITMTGQIMGTPNYMAPEQRKESGTVDHRADIYSLGVVFYEMLTGELPIGHFPLPSERVQVDIKLDDVVLKALATDPQLRYQRASEVRDDVTGHSKVGTSDRKPAKRKTQKGVKWLIAIACIILAGIIAVPFLLITAVIMMRYATMNAELKAQESAILEDRLQLTRTGLSIDGARKLWQNLAATYVNPKSNGSFNLTAKVPPPAPELRKIQEMFEPSMTMTAGSSVNRYYGYPFTALEDAHKVLDPTLIPVTLGFGRPTQLQPINSKEGAMDPKDLRVFLQRADAQELRPEDNKTKVTLIVSDGNHTFEVPMVFLDSHGWRIGKCALVEAIIDSIAVRRN